MGHKTKTFGYLLRLSLESVPLDSIKIVSHYDSRLGRTVGLGPEYRRGEECPRDGSTR